MISKLLKVPLTSCNFEVQKCIVCPNECILEKGEYGKCNVRKNRGNYIINEFLEKYSIVSVEPIEKKPFKHFMPDTKTLSLGNVCCNLNCDFCENHIITQKLYDKTENLGMSDLIKIIKEHKCKSICFTFNEPILNIEYIVFSHYFISHSGIDIKILLKTNAYCNKDLWVWILENIVDAVNIDWKGSELEFKRITGADFYVLEDRIKEAYESKSHMEISIPLYYRDKTILEKEMHYFGKFISDIDKSIPCHLLKVFPSYKMKDDRSTTNEEMQMSHDILNLYGLKNIYERS